MPIQEMIDDYILAMELLIKRYEMMLKCKNIGELGNIYFKACPLCILMYGTDCDYCPWTILADGGCLDDPKGAFMKIKAVMEKNYSLSSNIPPKLYLYIKERIKELKQWAIWYPEKVKELLCK